MTIRHDLGQDAWRSIAFLLVVTPFWWHACARAWGRK